jgi:hypothetical protein
MKILKNTYFSSEFIHPSFASRVSLREHEVLFGRCAPSRGQKTDMDILIRTKNIVAVILY